MAKKIITITRQYGSGGREIGETLAKRLGVSFWDNKLLDVAAKDSGIHKTHFEEATSAARTASCICSRPPTVRVEFRLTTRCSLHS